MKKEENKIAENIHIVFSVVDNQSKQTVVNKQRSCYTLIKIYIKLYTLSYCYSFLLNLVIYLFEGVNL